MVFKLIRSSVLTLGTYGEAALRLFFGDDLEAVEKHFVVYAEVGGCGCVEVRILLRTLEDLLKLQRLLGRSMVLIDDEIIQILETDLAESMYKEARL